MIQKLRAWITSHKKLSIGIAVVALLILLVVLLGGKKEEKNYTVVQRDVVDNVVVSGKVQLADEVDLSFGTTGTVRRTMVRAGDTVYKGQLLAQLDVADLQSRRSRLLAEVRRAELQSKKDSVNFTATKAEYDRFVADQDATLRAAVIKFLSNDVEARPVKTENSSVTAPTISGAYTAVDGFTLDNALTMAPIEYQLDLYPSSAESGYSYRLSGAETGYGVVSTDHYTDLGTRGLTIKFDPNVSYGNTDWVITIPNKQSSSYASAYDQFVSTITGLRSQIITQKSNVDQADALYGTGDSLSQINLAVARADLAEIDAQIREKSLYAPFSGIVGMIDVSVGDSVSTGKIAATVIGKKQSYIVKLKVPEGSVTKVVPGLPVSFTLDSQKDVTYTGTVTSVSPSETYIDGVPVYETIVRFDETKESIRSGMNVVATITTKERRDVLAVPRSAITFDGEKATVTIFDTEEVRPVTVGMLGSDDYFEISEGLAAGDVVVLGADTKK